MSQVVGHAATPRPERPLRADAERNRRRILDTADRLFAERGFGVTLNEIAREAGVGVGTVYRRFPNLQTLVDALFAEDLLLLAHSRFGLAGSESVTLKELSKIPLLLPPRGTALRRIIDRAAAANCTQDHRYQRDQRSRAGAVEPGRRRHHPRRRRREGSA